MSDVPDPRDDDLVDEASMESFPASDPPPFWAHAEPEPPKTAASRSRD